MHIVSKIINNMAFYTEVTPEKRYPDLYENGIKKLGLMQNILRKPRDLGAVIASVTLILMIIGLMLIITNPELANIVTVLLVAVLPVPLLIDSVLALQGRDSFQVKVIRYLVFHIAWKNNGENFVPAETPYRMDLVGKKAHKYLLSKNLTRTEQETYRVLAKDWDGSLKDLLETCKNLN